MEVKIDEKSIKKWSQDGKASWDRFLMDFGGILEASWEEKWSKIDPKRRRKSDEKKESHQTGQKRAVRRSNASRPRVYRAPGRG